MTKAPSSITAVRHAQLDGDDLAIADLHRQNIALRTELDEVQPVISAAVLAATAFRLRDQRGLIERAAPAGPRHAWVRGPARLRLSGRGGARTARSARQA